ncbi:hypothetical protein P4S64_03485 [Vibrio sp. M60_M31a]
MIAMFLAESLSPALSRPKSECTPIAVSLYGAIASNQAAVISVVVLNISGASP